jgi:hypothetical protein
MYRQLFGGDRSSPNTALTRRPTVWAGHVLGHG